MVDNKLLTKTGALYLFRDRVVKFLSLIIGMVFFIIIYLSLNNILPLKSEYGDVVVENIELRMKIDEKKQIRKIASEYAKTSLVIGQIEEKLSTTFSQAELARKFNSLAHESNVDIVSMNTRSGELISGYFSYINEASFKANYASIKKLLSSLELLPGFNSILELNLQKDNKKGLVAGTLVMVTAKGVK